MTVFSQKIRHVFADSFLTGFVIDIGRLPISMGFVLEPDLQIYSRAQ